MNPHVVITVIALAALAVAPRAAAQTPERPPIIAGCPTENLEWHACALQKAKSFNPPRTPSGKPDLQGTWRSRLTQSFSVEGVAEDHPFVKDPNQRWDVGAPEIVEPPDRKIPYQPSAARIGREGTNFREYVDPRTTCSTAGVPRLALQDPSQILQPPTDDHVLWLHEDHHQFRVIAMDQRPPVGSDVTTWNGLSRGRWDGNTLVIETANFNGYTWIDDAGNFYTNTASVTERLTLVDPNTIHYEATIADPTVYTRPWKVAWGLVRDTTPGGYELFEESCREGDRDLPLVREQGYKFYFGAPWRSR
ncbi:MAG: hypothetical protein HY824_11065 [Acidobacteria bacterium]|nr:hypothetical protein [Acidobacteriota bacterium]